MTVARRSAAIAAVLAVVVVGVAANFAGRGMMTLSAMAGLGLLGAAVLLRAGAKSNFVMTRSDQSRAIAADNRRAARLTGGTMPDPTRDQTEKARFEAEIVQQPDGAWLVTVVRVEPGDEARVVVASYGNIGASSTATDVARNELRARIEARDNPESPAVPEVAVITEYDL